MHAENRRTRWQQERGHVGGGQALVAGSENLVDLLGMSVRRQCVETDSQ
ncbi:unnamed protein product [Ectocarpus sp. CCAP 1310/34]|nr:unnamed protein product [Ectocarpus sp. CCAP 1310/34]